MLIVAAHQHISSVALFASFLRSVAEVSSNRKQQMTDFQASGSGRGRPDGLGEVEADPEEEADPVTL